MTSYINSESNWPLVHQDPKYQQTKNSSTEQNYLLHIAMRYPVKDQHVDENGDILELKCADCDTVFPDVYKVKKNQKCDKCDSQK